MIFATFFTFGGHYVRHAEEWAASCQALGLRHAALGLPACSWKNAVMQTGEACRAVVGAYAGEVVAFTDADARLVRRPDLLLGLETAPGYDVAVHYLDPGGRFADPPGSRECLNGTVVIWPTPAATRLVGVWCARNLTRREHRCADQLNLDAAIRETGARVYELPPEYCWIPDMSETRYGIREPVIVHGQASRENAAKGGG